MSDSCDSWIGMARPTGSMAFGIGAHAAQLSDSKGLAVDPCSDLAEENCSAILKLDQHSCNRYQRGCSQQQCHCHHEVSQSLQSPSEALWLQFKSFCLSEPVACEQLRRDALEELLRPIHQADDLEALPSHGKELLKSAFAKPGPLANGDSGEIGLR